MRLEEEKTKKEYQLNDSDYKICANSQQDILRKDNKHLQKKENSDNHNTRSDLNLTSSDNNPNNIPRGTPTSITNTPSSRSLSYMSTSTNTPSFTQGSMIASNSGYDFRRDNVLKDLLVNIQSKLVTANSMHDQIIIENLNRMHEVECQRNIEYILNKAKKLCDYFEK